MGKKHRRAVLEAGRRRSDDTLRIPPRPTTADAAPGHIATLPTAYRCMELLTHTAAQLRLRQSIGRTHRMPLAGWLRRPELWGNTHRRRDLVAAAMTSMVGWGAAYWYATAAGDRSWILAPVAPQRVGAALDAHYMRTWTLDGSPVPLAAGPPRRSGLLIAPFIMLPDQPLPLGPLQAARRAAAGWLDVESYAARVFRSGMHSGQRLETDQDLPKATAKRWRDDWLAAHSDPDESSIPVLGSGLRLVTDVINPADAQWLESRAFNAQEVARIFGVPARMLGLSSGDSVTYATARDNDADYLRYTLMGYLDPIEDAWSALLPPGRNEDEDQEVTFDLDGLMRPTTVDLWAALNAATAAGWMTVDEARGLADLDPLETPAPVASTPVHSPPAPAPTDDEAVPA